MPTVRHRHNDRVPVDVVPGGPVLVACAHGTRGSAGRRVVGSLVGALRSARPGLRVEAAFVDVQPPRVGDVVRAATETGRQAVVAPLLLSGGYHVHVDVARAVDGVTAVAAPALGPDDRISGLLLDRLREADATPQDAVVLAAAGSSDKRAAADVEQVRSWLAHQWPGPLTVGFGAAARPSVPEAIAAARAQHPGRRVVVASYLLAPGFFHDRLGEGGADLVTPPLGRLDQPIDQRLVDVVLDRYDVARRSLA